MTRLAALALAVLLAVAWWRRSWVPAYRSWAEYTDDELFV